MTTTNRLVELEILLNEMTAGLSDDDASKLLYEARRMIEGEQFQLRLRRAAAFKPGDVVYSRRIDRKGELHVRKGVVCGSDGDGRIGVKWEKTKGRYYHPVGAIFRTAEEVK